MCKTKYCWWSIDVQLHDGVKYVSYTVSSEKAATTLSMNYYHIVTLRLAIMQDQWSLTLHWCSISGRGRKHAAIDFASKGGQYLIYACFQTNRPLDYPSCKTKYNWQLVDAHFLDGAGSMSLVFLASKTATTSFLDVRKQSPYRLPRFNTKNRWHSIDAQFQDGTGNVSIICLPRKVANSSFINGWN
jgi:hypothetical protein